MPTNKLRYSVQMTEEEAARINALLGELKKRRAIPQGTSPNKLLLQLALERAEQREAELRNPAPPRPKSGR